MDESNNDVILRFLDDQVEMEERLLEKKGQELISQISRSNYGEVANILDEYRRMLNDYLHTSGLIGNIESDYVERGVEY